MVSDWSARGRQPIEADGSRSKDRSTTIFGAAWFSNSEKPAVHQLKPMKTKQNKAASRGTRFGSLERNLIVVVWQRLGSFGEEAGTVGVAVHVPVAEKRAAVGDAAAGRRGQRQTVRRRVLPQNLHRRPCRRYRPQAQVCSSTFRLPFGTN